MIRLSAPEDCEERQQFLEKWLLTDKKSEQFFILHCEYKFLGMRKYVSLNLSLIHNNEPGTAPARHADYGFKFALVALYYLYCRNNPHIQAFIDGKGREAAPMIKKPSASTQEYDYFGDKLTLSAEEWAVLSPVVQSLPTELDLYGSSAMAEPVTTSQAKKRRSKTPAIPPDAPPPQEAETIVSNYEDPEYAADLADHLSESKTPDKPTEPDNLS